MGIAVVVLLVLAPVALALAALVPRLFPRTVRRWGTAAVYAPLAAFLVYAWGLAHFYAPDVEESCVMEHGGWDPARAGVSYFPLSRTCNAYADMVPSYVNPTIFVLLAATALFTGLAVRSWRNSTRSRKELEP